jgi:hypothetical protein
MVIITFSCVFPIIAVAFGFALLELMRKDALRLVNVAKDRSACVREKPSGGPAEKARHTSEKVLHRRLVVKGWCRHASIVEEETAFFGSIAEWLI